MSYYIDNSYVSLNKHDEELCGDRVETAYYNGTQTLVLADGMGSGVRANILSSLTAKIICTMMSSGMSVEDCVETIAATLPMRKDVMVAYSTFTILQITSDGDAYMVQFDNPLSVLLRNGKAVEYPVEINIIGDGINDSPALSEADVGIAISDGAAIAREIADVTISAGDLYSLVTLRELGMKLMGRIHGNYRFIIGFNLAWHQP